LSRRSIGTAWDSDIDSSEIGDTKFSRDCCPSIDLDISPLHDPCPTSILIGILCITLEDESSPFDQYRSNTTHLEEVILTVFDREISLDRKDIFIAIESQPLKFCNIFYRSIS